MADVNKQLESLPDTVDKEKLRKETVFGIFVVHNKWVMQREKGGKKTRHMGWDIADIRCGLNRLKPKAAELPAEVQYFSGLDIEDVWVDYPWWVTGL